MKFRDSMNDYILDMYNISDMIFMLLLSLLVACIIIHQKKKAYPFTNSFKYIIEAFFIYVFDIRFAKKIQEDKYKIQTSNKICWVIKNGKIIAYLLSTDIGCLPKDLGSITDNLTCERKTFLC